MRRWAARGALGLTLTLALALGACGRVGFDPLGGGQDGAGHDGPTVDARADVLSTTPVTEAGAMPSCPSVVASPEGWAVAWTDRRDGNAEIYFRRLDGQGAPLGAEVRITNEPTDAGCAVLVWTGERYAIVFDDSRFGDTEVLVDFRSADGAEIGAAPARVTNDGGESTNPTIGFDGNGGYDVVWTDTNGVNDSMHTVHLDANGAPVGVELTLSGNSPFVREPAIVETGTGAAITWYDSSSGTDEVRAALVSSGAAVYNVSLGHAVTGTSFTGPSGVAQLGTALAVVFIDGTSGSTSEWTTQIAYVSSDGGVTPPRVLEPVVHEHPAMAAGATGFALVSEPGVRFTTYTEEGVATDATIVLGTNGSTPAIAHANGIFAVAYATATAIQLARIQP